MSNQSSGRVLVVRKEEKEAKLREFLRHDMDERAASDCLDRTCLLLARSPESPVAAAMLGLKDEIAAHGISVAVIFSSAEQASIEACRTWAGSLNAAARVLKGVGFLEGHEQLVLGPHTAWVGDCMRRDPLKRDAFEIYATDCAKTAAQARTSFSRLWNVAQALPAPVEELAPGIAAAALPADEAKPLVASRH